MREWRWWRVIVSAFVAGAVSGAFAALVMPASDLAARPGLSGQAAAPAADDLAALKAKYRRPAAIPFPANNSYSKAKRQLGEMLFHDPRLSADKSIACASCHDRGKGFADGKTRGSGVPGHLLGRHTPTLWNLAWGADYFWDGRARSLEQQAAGPIELPDEMAQPIAKGVARLSRDPVMVQAFAKAFPDAPTVSSDNLVKALATYERTFVSPPTRFDRWVAGDDGAMSASEIRGFRLFNGKAGCANCHSGFAFTDNAFHDIGLPGDDRGRGAVLKLPAAEHAFKTPGLREIGRSAPYMHDGSLKTLDDVIRRYESGIVDRPTLSADLLRGLTLSPQERADLKAFLGTLTSEREPELPQKIAVTTTAVTAPAVHVTTVAQDNKAYAPTHIKLKRGEKIWIVNNDTRTHNVRIFDPRLDLDSGAQEPGETVEVAFPKSGKFLVTCGIHPKMELHVDVEP